MLMIVFGAGLFASVRIISYRIAAAPWSAASVCADRADAVFRLVLQPLRAGEWDLVCTHCPGTDFVGRVAGAESPQYYPITSFT